MMGEPILDGVINENFTGKILKPVIPKLSYAMKSPGESLKYTGAWLPPAAGVFVVVVV